MEIDAPWTKRTFWGYVSSIRLLEQAFRAAGIRIDFEFSKSRKGERQLIARLPSNTGFFKIDGRTPDQVTKQAACFVCSGRWTCPENYHQEFQPITNHKEVK
jgi:hypothetical protein